jgi:hypothetical protein
MLLQHLAQDIEKMRSLCYCTISQKNLLLQTGEETMPLRRHAQNASMEIWKRPSGGIYLASN